MPCRSIIPGSLGVLWIGFGIFYARRSVEYSRRHTKSHEKDPLFRIFSCSGSYGILYRRSETAKSCMEGKCTMANIDAPRQPGSPQQADRLLPLGAFGTYLLVGVIFGVLATAGFGWLARGIFADRFVRIDNGVITWLHGYWSPLANQAMLLFTMLGDTAVLALLIALIAGTLLYVGRWIDAGGLVLAAGGAGII